MPAARGEKIVRSLPRSRWKLELRSHRVSQHIIGNAELRSARSARGIGKACKLLVAKLVQRLRLGRVVTVNVDDHGAIRTERWRLFAPMDYRGRNRSSALQSAVVKNCSAEKSNANCSER